MDKITQTSVDKIDLLLSIDNSASMSDKQAILRLAVPDLVERLVNPVCVDSEGNQYDPAPPGEPCPSGQSREFNPIDDIHVGVISSSLGDVGANTTCPARGSSEQADMGHLLGSLPRGAGAGANRAGFLEWRGGVTNAAQFSEDFARMVESVGEDGCGFEASLESWYRFLVDPVPYAELVRVACPGSTSGRSDCVQPARDSAGNALLDQTILDQRAAFLRPDSLVAVIMLSDENDCSVQMGGGSWLVLDRDQRMYRASSACAEDPNARCCYTCGASQPPAGCEPDPICEMEDRAEGISPRRMPPNLDHPNLRCFDQKRRFGIDLLYPTQRYVNALTQYELCVGAPDLAVEGCPSQNRVDNPLFASGRNRSLVFLGGIVGVPWQAISSDVDANGQPLEDPERQLRFKSFEQLNTDRTWDAIVGSRGTPYRAAAEGQPEITSVPRTPPANPYMIESELPRPPIMPGNEINGGEYDTTQDAAEGTPGDLQYACIFPLPESKVCTDELKANNESCDCFEGQFDKPLCRAPGTQSVGTTQHWAKAYPGARQLEVLRDFGSNSIVASICARNVDITTRATRPDFGYRPAIAAIVDRLKQQLVNRCLPRAMELDDDGTVPCTMVETKRNPEGRCECDSRIARKPPTSRVDALVRAQLASDGGGCGPDDPSCQGACLCEVLQVQKAENENPDEALRMCREEEEPSGVEGWCYVANTPEQQIGNPALVAECRATERQQLRFVGTGLEPNTTTFLACVGSSLAAREVGLE